MEITESELIEAIREAQAEATEDGGFTTSEVAGVLGIHKRYARVRLKRLLEAKAIEPCRVARVDAWGRQTTYLGYRLAGGE